jgi:DNA-3-methyladenine glycosylase II
LTRCIVYQQLNGKAAATIFGRLASACGEMSPERVLKLRTDRMRRIGLSKQKTEYVRSLAQKTRSGELQLETISSLGDNEVIHQLTQVKGIGVWTSHMFLMFALGRPDILPTGDYGIGAAMKKLYGLGAMPKPALMEQIAAPWMPWRTVASWYLWRSLEFKDEA